MKGGEKSPCIDSTADDSGPEDLRAFGEKSKWTGQPNLTLMEVVWKSATE